MHSTARLALSLSVFTSLVLGTGAVPKDARATHSVGAQAQLVAFVGDPATHAVFMTTPVQHEADWPDCSTVIVMGLEGPPYTSGTGPRPRPDAVVGELSVPRERWVSQCVVDILWAPVELRWIPEGAERRWVIEHFDDLESHREPFADTPDALPETLRVAVPSVFGHTGMVAPKGFEHLRVELVVEDVKTDVCMFLFQEPDPDCMVPGCPSCVGDACSGGARSVEGGGCVDGCPSCNGPACAPVCAHPNPDTCPDPCQDCVSDVITYRFRVTDTRTGASADGTQFIASAETLMQAEMVCPEKSPVEMALNELTLHETDGALIVYGSAIHGWMANDTSIPVIALLPKGPAPSLATPAPAAGCGSCQGGSTGGSPEGLVWMLIVVGALIARRWPDLDAG